MHITAITPNLTESAVQAASQAALTAGIEIRKLDDLVDVERAVELHRSIWGPEDRDLIGVATLRALSHADNYVFGAYLGDRFVGAITGFVGWHGKTLQLHSHILGVSPEVQGRNVGFALKEHQRAWCLTKGITTITWTFDPLVSRNAYFNLTKLGAAVTAYYPSFYGQMDDVINGSDDSDRVLIEWELGAPRALEASFGEGVATPTIDELHERGAQVALAVGTDDSPIETPVMSDTILVGIPRDIVELRRRDPQLGARWRSASRAALEGALNDGFAITALAQPGFYVLKRVI